MMNCNEEFFEVLEEVILMKWRTIDGERCQVMNEADIKAVEWHEPRLKHLTDRCRVTQYKGRIFVYTGTEVITVAKNQRWRSIPDLLKIGKAEVKKKIDKYEPNEVIV